MAKKPPTTNKFSLCPQDMQWKRCWTKPAHHSENTYWT